MIFRPGACALLSLCVLPAGAPAAWAPAERLPVGAPPPGPRPAVEAVEFRPPRPGPEVVRFRDGSEQELPGTEDFGRPEGVAVGGGVVAAAWQRTAPGCEGGGNGKPSYCNREVWATTWRRGETPPVPSRVSGAGDQAPSPVVGVGDDGTVLVAWELQSDAYDQEPRGVEAAVARAGGRLVRSPRAAAPRGGFVAASGIEIVRGRPQLSWFTDRDRGVTGVRAGRLGRWRREARLPEGLGETAEVLRSPRGDRLLWWEEEGTVFLRGSAPGRPFSRVQRRRGEPLRVSLGARGHFAVALRSTRRTRSRLAVTTGRTAGGRLRSARLGAVAHPLGDSGSAPAALGVDGAGRTYAAWTLSLGGGRSGVAVAAAARGRPFERRRVVSDRGASCRSASLAVLGRGRAAAQWICEGFPGFAERSVYRLGG